MRRLGLLAGRDRSTPPCSAWQPALCHCRLTQGVPGRPPIAPSAALALHASWWPTRTPRSHFVGWGVGNARLGSGARDPPAPKPPADTAGRAFWCWLLGLQRPHVSGLGTLRP